MNHQNFFEVRKNVALALPVSTFVIITCQICSFIYFEVDIFVFIHIYTFASLLCLHWKIHLNVGKNMTFFIDTRSIYCLAVRFSHPEWKDLVVNFSKTSLLYVTSCRYIQENLWWYWFCLLILVLVFIIW